MNARRDETRRSGARRGAAFVKVGERLPRQSQAATLVVRWTAGRCETAPSHRLLQSSVPVGHLFVKMSRPLDQKPDILGVMREHTRERPYPMPTLLEQEMLSQPEASRGCWTPSSRASATSSRAARLRLCADRRARHVGSRGAPTPSMPGPRWRAMPVALATPSLHTLYAAPPRMRGALVVGISQSGQSPDIVAVLEEGQAPGPADAGDHQRRRLAAGRRGRSRDRAARRAGAQRRRDQDLHRAAGGDGAAGGHWSGRPSGWPSCAAARGAGAPRWPPPAMSRGAPSATAIWSSAW